MTLHDHADLQITPNQDLSSKHFLQFPVRAHRYVNLPHDAALDALLQHSDWLSEVAGDPSKLFVLGEGSNTLFASDVIARWIISYQNSALNVIHDNQHEVIIEVGAGMHWDTLVAHSVAMGWCGLACLSLIPGTVGGAVVQNIGAYGAELSEVFVSCEATNLTTGERRTWYPKDADLAYRHSAFKVSPGWLVTQLTLRLSKTMTSRIPYKALAEILEGKLHQDPRDLHTIRHAVVSLRQSKLPDPKAYPNVGSFFKNPVLTHAQDRALKQQWPERVAWPDSAGVKYSAAWLIQAAGLKGYRKRGVGVSEKHALVLVHHGGATPVQMMDVVAHVQEQVHACFGVMLVPEVQIIQ